MKTLKKKNQSGFNYVKKKQNLQIAKCKKKFKKFDTNYKSNFNVLNYAPIN
jgi:hypothetical protein